MGKKHKTFRAMVEDFAQTNALKEDVRQEIEKRSLSKFLFFLRCDRNLTQKELADLIGCGQSRISKIEGAYDEDLTIKDLLDYAKALKLQLDLGYSDPKMSIVDQIKFHATEIKRSLERLRNLVKGDPSIANGIINFHEEALYNFIRLVGDSLAKIKIKSVPDKKSEEIIQISPSLRTEDTARGKKLKSNNNACNG